MLVGEKFKVGQLVRLAPVHRPYWEPEHGAFWVVVTREEFHEGTNTAPQREQPVHVKAVATGRYIHGQEDDFVLPDEEEGAST